MNADARFLKELAATIQNAAGSSSLLFLLVPDGDDEDECAALLAQHLLSSGLNLRLLPHVAATHGGPRSWEQESRTAQVHAFGVILRAPALQLGAVLQRYNFERGFIGSMKSPVLLFLSAKEEQRLQNEAPDLWSQGRPRVTPRCEALRRLLRDKAPLVPASTGPARPPIRFLHLSDVHLHPDDLADQARTRRGLLRLLQSPDAPLPLDFICVTGDLAKRAKATEYPLVVAWLEELLQVAGLGRDRLFVVPGNHDVDRDVGFWLRRDLAPRKESFSEEERQDVIRRVDRFFRSPEDTRERFHGGLFAAYQTALRGFLGDRPIGLRVGAGSVEVLAPPGEEVAIASFNSAWFALGDDDQGQLWIGDPCLAGACEKIDQLRQEGKIKYALALFHHPLDWLHPLDRTPVSQYLERSFDLVLRGHLHQSAPPYPAS